MCSRILKRKQGFGERKDGRECLAQVGVFDESLIRYSDLDLFIRLSDRYDFLHCKEPLVKSDGLSANHRAHVLARQYLVEKYRDRLERSNHQKHQQLLLKRATAPGATLTNPIES